MNSTQKPAVQPLLSLAQQIVVPRIAQPAASQSQSDGISAILQPPTRRAFLRKSATVAVAAGAAGMLLNSTARPARATVANTHSQQRTQFLSIQQHENDHVDYLVNALGSSARPKPTFQGLLQNTLNDFLSFSVLFENVGVAAYLGAAPAINDPDYLAAAGSIALIEARHAGYLNTLNGLPITGNIRGIADDNSFDTTLSAAEVVGLASPFITSLNGGAVPDYSDTPSMQNDIDILNFALALEFLEQEFYNLNVPVFFKR